MAIGAAIQAAVLQREKDAPRILLKNVTPLSLGIRLANGKMRKVINKNTPYPTEGICTGRTDAENQEGMSIVVYEGEHPEARFNKCLGVMTVMGIEKGPRGEGKVDISLKMNRLGELSATAIVQKTKSEKSMVINRPKQFNEQQLLEMKKEIVELPQAKEFNYKQANNKKNVGGISKRIKLTQSGNDDENYEHFDDDISIYHREGASSSSSSHTEQEEIVLS